MKAARIKPAGKSDQRSASRTWDDRSEKGNPTSGADKYQVDAYPVGSRPDADWDPAIYSFGGNRSPNGVIEYKSGAFGGTLRGSMLVCRYSGGDDVLVLRPRARITWPISRGSVPLHRCRTPRLLNGFGGSSMLWSR